jgi:hypothetical protein
MSATFSFEPAAKPTQWGSLEEKPRLNVSGSVQTSDSEPHAKSALPAEQQQQQPTSPTDVATLLSQAEALLASAAAESDQESPRQSNASATSAAVTGAPGSTPTSTRGPHKPAVLSLSLHSIDADAGDSEKQPAPLPGSAIASISASPSPSITTVKVPSTPTPPPPPVSTPSPTVVVPCRSSTPSEAHGAPVKPPEADAPSTVATAPAVPMLQLPIKECKDEVTPVKTLYSRLFREAQLREQRQAQAQRKRQAAQKAEEKEACTFHPRGAEAFGTSPSAKKKRAASTEPRSQTSAAASVSPHHTDPSPSPAAYTPNARGEAAAQDEETTACERLYRNAVQAERRERRLQQLREAQEEEFRTICTFHPCVLRSSASRQRCESNGRRSQEGEEGSVERAATSASRSRTPQRERQTQPRTWEHFLADQKERQAAQERHLAELKKRAAEQDHAKLYTGVPRSKASEHLKTYLEKKKGYKGPIEGWSERFEHYMKVKQAEEAESSKKSAAKQEKTNTSADHKDGPPHTPVSNRSCSRTRSESGGAHSGRNSSVFHRLYHDSDEREAMRELIRMMKEQHEQTVFFKPNTGEAGAGRRGCSNNVSNGSSRTPRRPHTSSDQADAAQETAAAVAVASGEAEQQHDVPADAEGHYENTDPNDEDGGHSHSRHHHETSHSIFDALYAEKESFNRRREMRHLQAQNNAEVFSFHPHLSPHSRQLAKDIARQKAQGEHMETVRERRAREAAQAAAQEAERRAKIQFRYNVFAQRQAERDRRREEELLHVVLHERSDDIEECRFRPSISEVTEAIVDGNKNYTQVIDDPHTARSLIRQRVASCSSSPCASKSVARGISAHAVPPSVQLQRSAEGDPSTNSTHSLPSMTPVQALAAGTDAVECSLDPATSGQFFDVFSAPINTYSGTSSVSSEHGFRRTEQLGKQRSQSPVEVSYSNVKESVNQSSVKYSDVGGDLDTVHIAGAASSEYLRQLEIELQDALKDWSQCI